MIIIEKLQKPTLVWTKWYKPEIIDKKYNKYQEVSGEMHPFHTFVDIGFNDMNRLTNSATNKYWVAMGNKMWQGRNGIYLYNYRTDQRNGIFMKNSDGFIVSNPFINDLVLIFDDADRSYW